MGTPLYFEIEVGLPRDTAFDLLDRHFRALGYRVEESDRMNHRLVLDRGWVIGALLGGPVRRRHVWLRATAQQRDPQRTAIHLSFQGYRKALDERARRRYTEEVRAFEQLCRAQRAASPGDPAGAGTPPTPMLKEVVIKEVVRIPCRYCGNLVDNTARKCDDCGAPLR
jgi:hypothetical protein